MTNCGGVGHWGLVIEHSPITFPCMGAPRNAVVLLSGGLDSATVLAIAKSRGYACHALTVRYGQRHDSEIAAAGRVAAGLGVVGSLALSWAQGSMNVTVFR